MESLDATFRRALAFVLSLAAAAALAAPPAAAGRNHASHRTGSRSVRLLVEFRSSAGRAEIRRAIRDAGALQVRAIAPLNVHVVRVPRAHAAAALAALERAHVVADAERDGVFHVVGAESEQLLPNDPWWPQEWDASQVDAPNAWAVTTGAPGVVVAVLDTGVAFGVPDLQGAFVPGYDFVNNDSNPSDDNGHGTAVAGIVAARINNGLGGVGFCPQCSLMPVKVADQRGSVTSEAAAAGITWATDHGARVISMSFAGASGGDVLENAIDYAAAHGVLVVAAAGNNGTAALSYPAAYPHVISVAATDPSDRLYPWSSFGSWVDLAAPGCAITGFVNADYGQMCGTSASTPVVSGLAGLALSYSPAASPVAVEQALESGTVHTDGVAYGRVDAANMLRALGAVLRPAPPPPPPPPAANAGKSGPDRTASSGSTRSGGAKAKNARAKKKHKRAMRRYWTRLLWTYHVGAEVRMEAAGRPR